MTDVSSMSIGSFSSDEGDGVALYVYPMGNGDWYVSVGPERDDGGLPMGDHAVRFRTSGSQHDHDAVLAVALLYRLATRDSAAARHIAGSLLRGLAGPEDRDLCPRCASPDRLALCENCGEEL